MEADDDVPLILTWDEANSGLLSDDTERGDESKWSCVRHLLGNDWMQGSGGAVAFSLGLW